MEFPTETLDAIRTAAHAIAGAVTDHDALLEAIGDCRFVLIGEASHGTHEFYYERAEITKGPYFAEQGDFATAGTINLVTRSEFEHSSLGFGAGGSPGHGGPLYRGLLVASPKLEGSTIKPLVVAEIGRRNGPFHNPERFDSYKAFGKLASIAEEDKVPNARAMITNLVKGNEAVARTARKVFPIAEKANDEPTCDLLTQRMQIHEKTAWMLRSLLEK